MESNDFTRSLPDALLPMLPRLLLPPILQRSLDHNRAPSDETSSARPESGQGDEERVLGVRVGRGWVGQDELAEGVCEQEL